MIGRWNFDTPVPKIEQKVRDGDPISEKHLAAHRITREEILHATLEYVGAVIKNYYAYTGEYLDEERLMHVKHPEALWERIREFLANLRNLPCWVDKTLSGTAFGSKQTRDYWMTIYKTGVAPTGTRVLTEPISIQKMIVS